MSHSQTGTVLEGLDLRQAEPSGCSRSTCLHCACRPDAVDVPLTIFYLFEHLGPNYQSIQLGPPSSITPYIPVTRARGLLVFGLLVGLVAHEARTDSQPLVRVTSPAQEFGARIGDDYFLATYSQLEQYWKKLDAESDRVRLVSIGQTEEGRTQWMSVVSSPENLARLDDTGHSRGDGV